LESILNESKNDVKPNFTAQQAKETFKSRWKDPLKDTYTTAARQHSSITEPRISLTHQETLATFIQQNIVNHMLYSIHVRSDFVMKDIAIVRTCDTNRTNLLFNTASLPSEHPNSIENGSET
jgi:hypothetical protein